MDTLQMNLRPIFDNCLTIRQLNSIHLTSIKEAGLFDKLDTVNLENGTATKVVFFISHISVFSLHNEAGTREMVSNYSTLRDPFLSHQTLKNIS